MNRCVLLVALILTLISSKSIPHDQVQPFPEVEPVTESDKVAFKYKPQLEVSEGCQPYPAVQEDGSTSKGLRWFLLSAHATEGCEGSSLGSQVYARSTEYRGKWAIMYAWYFPRGREPFSISHLRPFGHRHNWEFVIVWLDKLSLKNSTILGVSTHAEGLRFSNHVPLDTKYVDGSSVKIEYYNNLVFASTGVRVTKMEGEFQDLIMWDQLPDAARDALAETDWDSIYLALDSFEEWHVH